MTLFLDHCGLLFENLYIDYVTSSKDILVYKIHDSSGDICVHVEKTYFSSFQNIVETTNIYPNRSDFLKFY